MVAALFCRIERDLPAIRRPARSSYVRAAEERHLHRVAAITIASPDFKASRTIGSEDYLLTIRRELRLYLHFRGRDQLLWQGLLIRRVRPRNPPDVGIEHRPLISQT